MSMYETSEPIPELPSSEVPMIEAATEVNEYAATRVAEGISHELIRQVIDRHASGTDMLRSSSRRRILPPATEAPSKEHDITVHSDIPVSEPTTQAESPRSVEVDRTEDTEGELQVLRAFERIQYEIEIAAQRAPAEVERRRTEFVEGLQAETGAHRRTYEMDRIEYDQALDGVMDIFRQDGRRVEGGGSYLPCVQTLRFGFVKESAPEGGHAMSDFKPVVSHLLVRMRDTPTRFYPALSPTRVRVNPEDKPRYVVEVTRRDMPAEMTDDPSEDMKKVYTGGEIPHEYYFSDRRYVERKLEPLPKFKDIVQRAVEDEVGSNLRDMDTWGLSRAKAQFPAPTTEGRKVTFLGAYRDHSSQSREVIDNAHTLLEGLYEGGEQPTHKTFQFFARSPSETSEIIAEARRMCERPAKSLHETSLDAGPLLMARVQWLETVAPGFHRAAVDVMRHDDKKIYDRIETALLEVRHASRAAQQFLLDLWKDAPLRILKDEN